METADSAVSHEWSAYWAEGHAHSCPTTFAAYYGANTQAFWAEMLGRVQPDDCWLELACGGGGLIELVTQCVPGARMPRVIGVDLAEVKAVVTRRVSRALPEVRARINVVEQVDAASLPLPDASVSYLVSQFGFEYVSREPVQFECARVLAPRASLGLILHKRGSKLHRLALAERAVARAALASDGLLACCRAAIPVARDARAGMLAGDQAARAAQVRERYNAAVRSLLAVAEVSGASEYAEEMLHACSALVTGRDGGAVATALQQLDALCLSTRAQSGRLQALDRAALDSDALAELEGWLSSIGFTSIETSTLYEAGHEMGWTLRSTREQ